MHSVDIVASREGRESPVTSPLPLAAPPDLAGVKRLHDVLGDGRCDVTEVPSDIIVPGGVRG